MVLSNALGALFFASFAAGAVFPRRGSAAPYSNVTFTTTLSVPASTTPLGKLPVASYETPLQSLSSSGTGVSDEHAVTQPTVTSTSGPQDLSILSNATASATPNGTLDIKLSQSGAPSFATPSIAPFPINDTKTLTTPTSNAACTINIPNANVDYWFPATYSYVVATMTTDILNFTNAKSYTLVPNPTPFDVSFALEHDWACTTTESYYPEDDYTITMCEAYKGKPTAAITSVAYRSSGIAPFPAGNVIPVSDATLYDVYNPESFPLATVTITLAPNITQIQTSATPFAYFTAYEVESGNTTETIQLRSVQAYPYWLKGIEDESTATGPLPDGFLEQIPHSACDAGHLQAVVTVIIVVDLYYQNRPLLNPLIIHVESSVLGWGESPVVVNNWGDEPPHSLPVTVTDWDLPNTDTKPTSASIKPNNRPEPVPATQVRGGSGDGHNILNPPEPTRTTLGSIGTNPVVLGPSSVFVVGSQTLQVGGSPIDIGGGTFVSLAPSATAIIVNGMTSMLPQAPPPRLPPVLTIGSSTLTANAATQFFVDSGQILTPGGVATIGGQVVSLGQSASYVVVAGSTQVLPAGPESAPVATNPPQIVVGGSTISAQATQTRPNGGSNQNNPGIGPTFIISSQTLIPGGFAITVSGTTLLLAPSAGVVVINGVTSTLKGAAVPVATPPTITVGNNVFSPLPGSGNTFVIAGQTLAPGGSAITVSGTTLSLGPSASFVVANSATLTLGSPVTQANVPPTITIGNAVFSALPEPSGPTFIVDGQTLIPGGPAITALGTTLSLAPSASFVVINGATSALANPSLLTTAPPLTIGDATFRPLPGTGTAYVIGSALLTAGGFVVVSGTTISLAAEATALVIDGQTSIISPLAQPIVTNAPLLTIGTETFTAVSGGGTAFIIRGQTLTPGGTITVYGDGGRTTISLASGATELIYGISGRSTRTALFPATTTRSQSVTSTSDARAGSSRLNGEAKATSQKGDAALQLRCRSWVLLALLFIPGYFLV
ncbi:hypothetical protein P3342_002357 [Pyrenophora teres f. teres]|nr:hypothetical protein P3342_002357 [Pyrenophora teres f. teres]